MDSWLRHFLEAITQPGVSAGITVFTNGMLISGKAIALPEYFALMGEQLAQGLEKSGAKDVQIIRDTFTAKLSPTESAALAAKTKTRSTKEPEDSPHDYIMLKDVKIAGVGQSPIISLPVWRGRLSTISGWTLGELGQGPAPAQSQFA